MGVWGRGGRHARWIVVGVGVAIALLVGTGLFVRYVVFDDSTTVIGTADALESFREQSTTVPGTRSPVSRSTTGPFVDAEAPPSVETTTTVPLPSAPLAAPGVYEFDTSGFERIDALGGTRHDYPDTTTMTVVVDGCGVSVRWDALEERWDRWGLCSSPDGVVLAPDGAQFHEFYGRSEREKLRCDRSVLVVPVDNEPRRAVEQACTLASDEYLPTWKVMGAETRDVGGETVEVQRVRQYVDDDDEHWERITVDWYLTDGGLPVEVVGTRESLSSTFVGEVHYEEQFHLVLRSLTPLR